jgi:hypothetical protein
VVCGGRERGGAMGGRQPRDQVERRDNEREQWGGTHPWQTRDL